MNNSSKKSSYPSNSSALNSSSSLAPWKSKQYGSSIIVHNFEDEESFLVKKSKRPAIKKDGVVIIEDDDDEGCTWFGRLVRTGIHRVTLWLKQDDARDCGCGAEPMWEERRARTAAGTVRRHLYDPVPTAAAKFSNQYNAALLTGITVGLWIIPFKLAIEMGLDLIWKRVPDFLQQNGVFENLAIPSYLYTAMVVTTGCTLCGLQFEKIKSMPNQNSLLDDMAAKGSISARDLWPLVGLAFTAMWSGLPLGPELPLLLIFSMFGSWIGQQLRLDRDQNLALLYYSMSAAIGAFFSYPIGAFLFVLEVPHRMGVVHRMGRLHARLLGPCAVASLTATVIHSYLTGRPVERLFAFPGEFSGGVTYTTLFVVLPAVAVGSGTGILYTFTVKWLKTAVHGISDLCIQVPTGFEYDADGFNEFDIYRPKGNNEKRGVEDAERAARNKLLVHGAVCTMVGLLYSVICMTFPHVFSWGEAQLQNALDGGASELPFFGGTDSPLRAPFVQCMSDQDASESAWCMTAIPLAKTVAIGLVLGTSIQCGHFWGPAYVGATVAQLALFLVGLLGLIVPESSGLFILCVMASAHVVTYRSPLGISFLLMQSAGYDIIASTSVLVAAHMSLHISRDVVFYQSQCDHTPVADE